jgi:hypothetical protein
MIFGTMHLLGFSYAPRIKDLKHQRLYTFKSRRGWDRAQVKVGPSGYIDTQIIEDNWDDILRFIATIKLKETTASEIFRRRVLDDGVTSRMGFPIRGRQTYLLAFARGASSNAVTTAAGSADRPSSSNPPPDCALR